MKISPRTHIVFLALAAAWSILAACSTLRAGDWPTYRHDNARSGVTPEQLALPLAPCWTFQPRHAPEPAWGNPNPRPVGGWYGQTELRRVHFDDAFHVAAAGDAVYFGSSADGKVYALDAAGGKVRWSALTGGPVRLAPTVWEQKVYVGSDDGFAYCLQASDGKQVWKFRAAPSDQKVLGSGRMISLWPLRTGVLVDDGIAYFSAGIFPAEGVYMYAVRAEDGSLIWCNDTCAAAPQSRMSPQGYLLASADALFAPMGRTSPAAFDRRDGRLIHETAFGHQVGGTYALLADDYVFTGTEELIGYNRQSRARFAWFGGRQIIVARDLSYMVTDREMVALDRAKYPEASLRCQSAIDERRRVNESLGTARRKLKSLQGEALKSAQQEVAKIEASLKAVDEKQEKAKADMAAAVKWQCPAECPDALILAGNLLFAGGKDQVVAVEAATGKKVWTGKVDGTAKGLAVAAGRLLVSTDTGAIACFGPAGTTPHGPLDQKVSPAPYLPDDLTPAFEAAAKHILDSTGITKGYCLVLDCGTGRLAFELAKRSELNIYGVESDPRKVETARKALDAAGLYGSRVCIGSGDASQVSYSDYFANLIVSEGALVSGELPKSASEAIRMLKPMGGTIMIGQPAGTKRRLPALKPAALSEWLSRAGIEGGQVTEKDGTWLKYARGPLAGAGSWTHQYAEPGNTTCSDDQLVKCPLGLLWFGEPGPGTMADRHIRATAPLATGGRFFVQGEGYASTRGAGENVIAAYDAYNGRKLWERAVPSGTLRTGMSSRASNLAANADSLFAIVGDKCLRLDAATGETKFTYQMPAAPDGKQRNWEYLACVGDLLYGARAARPPATDGLFALDVADGRPRWSYAAGDVPCSAIAIGDGMLFFADKQTAPVYRVVALDAVTGKKLWEKPVDLTGCCSGHTWGTLGAMYRNNVLLLFGVYSDGHYWQEFFQDQFGQRRVVALSAKDGNALWSKLIGYRVRPLVVGDTFHAEPWAFDLATGRQKTRIHPVTGREEVWQFARPGHHCGCPAASPHTLLFRSNYLGWYDLAGDTGTRHFGAQRPGCWINFIPANGLLIVPEASSGCLCAFPNMCTVVFKHREEERQWAWYSSPGPMTPVKRLALNFGSPGDRKDRDGALWFGYPRPGGPLVLQFKVDTSLFPGGGYFNHDPARLEIEGTDKPWVFHSGIRGLRQCELPLQEAGAKPSRYTVRLAFAELDQEAAGARVFDIKLQDKVVAKDFDVLRQAGGRRKAILSEFPGVEAGEKLKLELAPKTGKPTAEQLPVLQGIEVVRED